MRLETFIWYAIPLILFLLFFAVYGRNHTSLTAGFFLSCAVIALIGIFVVQAYYSGSRVLRAISVLPLLALALFLGIGMYFFVAFLILNTRLILKREKRDLKYLLTLILAVGLLLILIVPHLVNLSALPRFAVYLSYSVYGLAICYLIHMAQYVISVILCNLPRPKKNQDYIIVLGCWIKNGKVTPILARRIDKAIAFYERQKELREPPKLVLSGGKGSDETCSEAEAMRVYALEKGMPEGQLLLEPNSVSTLENMKFSKELMDRESGGKPYRCIYATNNYHVLRAGIYARRAGLKVNGIGAKTALYYLPNAILREYIAYIYLYLKWNIAFGVFGLLFGSVVLPILLHRPF